MSPSRSARLTALGLALGALAGCPGASVETPVPAVVAVSPALVEVAAGATQRFSATVTGADDSGVYWSVDEAGGGRIDASGLYTAPAAAGIWHVLATSRADPSASGRAEVVVPAPQPVTVAVSPRSAAVQTGATQQFTAAVAGAANVAVSWSVQETGGGSIDAAGLYTAPPSPGTYHVVAASDADPTKSDTATVTVTEEPPPATVAIDPPTATVQAGATQRFTATVTGASNAAVAWTVDEMDGGSVDSSGLYTAPLVAGTYHVRATSQADSTKSDVAAVDVVALDSKPTISAFYATPATLPAGGGNTTLSWQVTGADSLTIDNGIGAVAGQSRAVAVSATTTFMLSATNAHGTSTASTVVTVSSGGTCSHNPTSSGGRMVAMVAPVDGESFTAPALIRLVAAARDPNVFTNYPTDGKGGNAASVQFIVDDAPAAEVSGADAEYWVFKGFANGIGAGTHTVRARAVYTNPALTLDSLPVTITVAAPPAYAQVVDLIADLNVAGASYTLAGTPSARIRLNGNGHRIVGGGATAIAFRNVDFFGLGDPADPTAVGVDLTTSSGLELTDCTFDGSNAVRFTLTGAAPATIRGNTFRSNMRQPIGQYPDGGQGAGSGSFPSLEIRGASTGAKVLAANRGAAGWFDFGGSARNWVIGGDTDADSNILIGPRVGIYADRTTQDMQIRRNYTHHVYFGGWSQGSNYELGGVSSLLAEHNVVVGSSWPVRGVGGEFRYNLVLEAGHEWLWADSPNGYVHHNVFAGGEADVGGIWVLYDHAGIRIENNTIDGMGASTVAAAVKQTAGSATLRSNLFVNVPVTPVSLTGGAMSADYNLFWSSASPSYSDGRTPANDARADPLLASPASSLCEYDEAAVWQRRLGVSEILAQYRAKYAPGAGSPALDKGDPALGAGNDIGAIGGGVPHGADLFGK